MSFLQCRPTYIPLFCLQAQVVLQGKSRQAIIRELQKTSLDVNLAVNNLLSRDDDDPEEPDDESYMQESYFPGGKRFFKFSMIFLIHQKLPPVYVL